MAVMQPGTPILLRNYSDADFVFFACGAPAQPAGYEAEILDEQL